MFVHDLIRGSLTTKAVAESYRDYYSDDYLAAAREKYHFRSIGQLLAQNLVYN